METVKKNIILLGDGATGKTSLIRRFVTDQFSDKYLTTLGSKVTKKDIYLDYQGEQRHMVLLIWDILGQKDYKYTQALSFGGIEGALMVADITRRDTLDSLGDYWVPSLVSVTGALPMVFLGNKSDLGDQAEFGEEELGEFAGSYEPCELRRQHFLTSAKVGDSVESAFRELAGAMLKLTYKAKLTYSQFIMDKTEVGSIRDVVDYILADFTTQFGGSANAGPIMERLVLEAGLDINQPAKRDLVELVNSMAKFEGRFKPEKVVSLNRSKRLYLVNLF